MKRSIEKRFQFLNPQKKLILVTGHRRENFGDGFERICSALKKISERSDVQIVYPVHLNPNVKKPVFRFLKNCNNIFLTVPQDYLSFVFLMLKAFLIITDSGGIQEEAISINKPVLIIRDNTERQETVDIGAAKIVGTNTNRIVNEAEKLIEHHKKYCAMTKKKIHLEMEWQVRK